MRVNLHRAGGRSPDEKAARGIGLRRRARSGDDDAGEGVTVAGRIGEAAGE